MSVIYDLEHTTTYRYRQPVRFGQHQGIFFTQCGCLRATELRVTFHLRGEHLGIPAIADFPLLARAEEVPVQYTPDEWIDLAVFMRPHTEDEDGTLDVLQRMMGKIGEFTYQARETEGTQAPAETLRLRSGTCRDYAWLMIEALRRLGFACRFVRGYLYDPALDQGGAGMVGSGATHAWLQVYLPGAGWRAPTTPPTGLRRGRI
ncbi:hypothetical protein LQF76_08520 [Gloeomargaritales cyanobacterium VI4D9]|nr:hypothetical protein LQF76_08520 [Gloeomargaritales cyanobacterium VI4D9]